MNRIRYHVKVLESMDVHVDALVGNTIVEYKQLVSEIRVLHSAIIEVTKILAELPGHSAIILLDDSRISISRLKLEWESLDRLFQPSIIDRLSMVTLADGVIRDVFGFIGKEEENAIPEIRRTILESPGYQRRWKPDAFLEILRILLIQWFRKRGPMPLNQVSRLSGYSYPRIAASLEKLEPYLLRHSDRSVELQSFPGDAWLKLVAASDEIRRTRGYSALRPRPTETILERVKEQRDHSLALGGIIGARHYMPGIDLIGIHRIDLTVHQWSKERIDRFVRELDPGLKPARRGVLPQVVIHGLYRSDPLYVENEKGIMADEVECLLDLHEARMESQALELLEHLKKGTVR